MKRYIFLLLMFTLCIDTNAQELVHFEITSNGSFKTIEDIKNVSGIGDSLFEKIKDLITI